MLACPDDNNEPKLNLGVVNPNPKNASDVSATITDGIVCATSRIIRPIVLGNKCLDRKSVV